ncbi:MAG: DUF1967 domain-containing protein [Erysipelotrichia bacterium]|nr:DUF1967 domain-containing protein [Erysipelotrichia bacterium]
MDAIWAIVIILFVILVYLKKIIDLAQKLDVKVLVFGSPKNRFIGNMDRNEAYQIAIEFFKELGDYEYRLLERPQIVVANKMDLDDAKDNLKRFKQTYPDVEVFETTTLIAEGLDQVLYKAADLLDVTPAFPLHDKEQDSEGVLYRFEEEKPAFEIHNLGNGQWMITGDEIERAFKMATLDNVDGEHRFARKMRVLGVDQALRDAGCQDGDVVSICDIEFEFVE